MKYADKKYSIENAPDCVKFNSDVEIYEAGNVVRKLGNMYKYSGAIFGVSIKIVVDALNNGKAEAIQTQQK